MKDTLKTIPLATVRQAINGRRQFLKGSIVLTGLLSSGSMLAMLAPSKSWALTAHHLNAEQANDLLIMAKRLYPHKGLSDAVYALLVKDIDEACTDATNKKLVANGIAKLNASFNGNWAAAAQADQVALLKTMESDTFFQMVRGQCIHSLYDNDMAYAHFGYEGESWTKGGYIRRGFNDLTWLPNPPESASPAPL